MVSNIDCNDNFAIKNSGICNCGIMNYWASWNYGAILTCYALQELVKNLGAAVQVINFRPKVWDNKKLYPRNKAKEDFVNKYFSLTTVCKNRKDLCKLNNSIDTFIVGSDQVWNWNYTFNYLYFFDFVKNSKKKIACAASMIPEHFKGDEDLKTAIEYYLSRFDSISVREKDAIKFCKNQYNIDADIILDPVFLLDKNCYINLINENSTKNSKREYVAAYFLEYNEKLNLLLDQIKEKYNIDIVKMNRGESIEDWLKIIRDAKFIITDSYHGTCFSIIFEKQFVSLTNRRGNSRFYSLLSILNLEDRIFEKIDNIIIDKLEAAIDYIKVNEILQKYTTDSLEWIKNALIKPKVLSNQSVENRLIHVLIENRGLPKSKPYIQKVFIKAKTMFKNYLKNVK